MTWNPAWQLSYNLSIPQPRRLHRQRSSSLDLFTKSQSCVKWSLGSSLCLWTISYAFPSHFGRRHLTGNTTFDWRRWTKMAECVAYLAIGQNEVDHWWIEVDYYPGRCGKACQELNALWTSCRFDSNSSFISLWDSRHESLVKYDDFKTAQGELSATCSRNAI